MSFFYSRSIAALFLLHTLYLTSDAAELSFWRKIPENACGLVSFSVCCHIIGVSIDTDDLVRDDLIREYGTSLFDLKNLALNYNIHAKCLRANAKDLLRNISEDRPAIVKSAASSHFFVTTGYNHNSKSITIIEPSGLFIENLSFAEFLDKYGGEAMILSRTSLRINIIGSKFVIYFTVIFLVFVFFLFACLVNKNDRCFSTKFAIKKIFRRINLWYAE